LFKALPSKKEKMNTLQQLFSCLSEEVENAPINTSGTSADKHMLDCIEIDHNSILKNISELLNLYSEKEDFLHKQEDPKPKLDACQRLILEA